MNVKVDTGELKDLAANLKSSIEALEEQRTAMQTNAKIIASLWSGCDANKATESAALNIASFVTMETKINYYVSAFGEVATKYDTTDSSASF